MDAKKNMAFSGKSNVAKSLPIIISWYSNLTSKENELLQSKWYTSFTTATLNTNELKLKRVIHENNHVIITRSLSGYYLTFRNLLVSIINHIIQKNTLKMYYNWIWLKSTNVNVNSV